MAVGYWLAVVPSVAISIGFITAVWRFFRDPSTEWSMLLGLSCLVALALVYTSLAVPFFGQIKAHYGLCGLIPVSAFAAKSLDVFSVRIAKIRLVVWIAFGLWALNSYCAFWISRTSKPAMLARALSPSGESDRVEVSIRALNSLLKQSEGYTEPREALIGMLLDGGRDVEATNRIELLSQENPMRPDAQLMLAKGLAWEGRVEEATEHAREALRLAPGYAPAFAETALLLARQKNHGEAGRYLERPQN